MQLYRLYRLCSLQLTTVRLKLGNSGVGVGEFFRIAAALQLSFAQELIDCPLRGLCYVAMWVAGCCDIVPLLGGFLQLGWLSDRDP